jgi:YfiH family protein
MTEPPVLTSPVLDGLDGVRHAFFTREGGVSSGLHASLNVGRGSSDDPTRVAENRRRCAAWFGRDAGDLTTCYQSHSTIVRIAVTPWGDELPEGDAVASTSTGVLCGVLTADCAPVLMADPVARVVCAVHAGWKGALDGVLESAVHAMVALGARADAIHAAIGPCIGPDSYEVGTEFVARFIAHLPRSERFFHPADDPERRRFDLPAFVEWRLAEAGVGHARWTGHDTCADEDRFYSNRRAFKRGETDYGRLLSAIILT